MRVAASCPWIRITLSLGVLAVLLTLGDARSVLGHIARIEVADMVLVWSVFGASLLLSAWRWQVILAARGARVPLRELLAAYLAGLFFNQVLPGSVGGDVGRACHLYAATGRGREAASSALLDRLCGVMGLAALTLSALMWIGSELPSGVGGLPTLAVGFGLLAIGLGVWWGCGHALIRRVLDHMPENTVTRTARSLAEALLSYRREPALLAGVAVSVPIQALQAGLYGLVAHRLGFDIGWEWFLLLVPVAQIVAMLPLSLGGLGVREATLAALFAPLGVPAADIVAVSLAVHALTAAFGLAGGALVLLAPTLRRALAVPAVAPPPPNLERGTFPAPQQSHLGLPEPLTAPLRG
jgi:hypothetical protein